MKTEGGRWRKAKGGMRTDVFSPLFCPLRCTSPLATSARATLSMWAMSLCYVINNVLHGAAS